MSEPFDETAWVSWQVPAEVARAALERGDAYDPREVRSVEIAGVLAVIVATTGAVSGLVTIVTQGRAALRRVSNVLVKRRSAEWGRCSLDVKWDGGELHLDLESVRTPGDVADLLERALEASRGGGATPRE